MALEICEKESLKLRIGEEEIEIYFRRPRAKEMVKYLAQTLEYGEEKNWEKIFSASMELASSCLVGIKKGDIVLEEKGEKKPLITDPNEPGYLHDWKEVLSERIPELFLSLADYLLKITRSELEVREKNFSETWSKSSPKSR